MKKNNITIKTHVCPTCGGNLKVDLERQMYECPFCGVTFDYEYFQEDDVLEIADRAMSIGENDSAKRAYEFMLKKDPKNFFAIRGLLLLSLKLKSVSELSLTESYKKRNFANVERKLEQFQNEVAPEYREYYSDMTDLVKTGREVVREEEKAEQYRSSKLSALVSYEEQDISYYDLTDTRVHNFSRKSRKLLKTSLVFLAVYLICVLLIYWTMNVSPDQRSVVEANRTVTGVAEVDTLKAKGESFDDILIKEHEETLKRGAALEEKQKIAEAKKEQNAFENGMQDIRDNFQKLKKDDPKVLTAVIAVPLVIILVIYVNEGVKCVLFRMKLKRAR